MEGIRAILCILEKKNVLKAFISQKEIFLADVVKLFHQNLACAMDNIV